MAASTFFKNEKEEESFMKWFWTGENGNKLIERLNAFHFNISKQKGSDFVRRETNSPTVYGIVVEMNSPNHDRGLTAILRQNGQIRLMKVGYTQLNTKPEEGNRMETVMAKILSNLAEAGDDIKAKIVLSLPLDFCETNTIRKTEADIRSQMGIEVPTDIARKLQLPNPTEWVFTSQKILEGLRRMINDQKKKFKSGSKVTRVVTTKIFSNFAYVNFDEDLPGNTDELLDKLERMYGTT